MGGKRKAQPSGTAEGKAAASSDAAAGQGGASWKRQTLGVGADAGSAEGGSSEQKRTRSILAPVTISMSMLCDPTALVWRKAALEAAVEAALRSVVAEFGGRELTVEWTLVGPSEDTLQRVLPLVLERVGLEGAAKTFQVCKVWRRELEARGFCNRTVQMCAAHAEHTPGYYLRLRKNALRRLNVSACHAEREFCFDTLAFLEKWLGTYQKTSLREWLQAASQEPDASFFSRGAASTAQIFGLPLVRWVGKPQGRNAELDQANPGLDTLPKGHSSSVSSMAISSDGKRVITGSHDALVKIWNAETGAEVSILDRLHS